MHFPFGMHSRGNVTNDLTHTATRILLVLNQWGFLHMWKLEPAHKE